ncbi:MAG: hypothetical protein OEM50_06440, partial [Gammaproteobacteria bacterium]|nr:hypothetical protein [Gammaproteobacteria bacterium]
ADRFVSPENIVSYDGSLYWIEGGDLHTLGAGGQVMMLADGLRDAAADVTVDIVVDATHVYWVDQAPTQNCSPPCDWLIQKVPLAGGATITLATADRRIDALEADADNIFWEEGSSEPWTADCDCGSKIKSIPKTGGAAILLVDGSLNGTLPPPPPGHTPGSWYPTGGIVLTASDVIFAAAGATAYVLKSIPKAGGEITDLASVASTAGLARNAVLDITVGGDDLYWIDTGNEDLKAMPPVGGPVSIIVAGLVNPGGLAVNAGRVFWTESGAYAGCCLAMGAGSVRSVAISGGNAETLVSNLDAPLKVSADETNIVWTEFWRIAQGPVSGGNAATLVSGIAGNLSRIAVSQSSVFILDDSLIKVVPVAGGTLEKLAPANSGGISDFSQREGDIGADNDNVYWTTLDVTGAPVVRKVSVAGGDPMVIANEGGVPNPQDCYWRIAVDQQNVYWSEGSTDHPVGCAVKSVPLAGGAVTELLDQPFVADFTVDGTNVYFSEFEGPSIQKLPIDGGASTLAVSGQIFAVVLGNDADNIFWLDPDPNDMWDGNFATIPKTADPSDWWMLPIEIQMDPIFVLDGFVLDQDGLSISEATTGTIYRIF